MKQFQWATIFLLLSHVGALSLWPGNKLWTPEGFPNPMKDPAGCGRGGVKNSAVCDPDRVMAAKDQDVVEEVINNTTNVEIAAVLVNHMDLSRYGGDVDDAARGLAMALHDAWGVGDSSRNDGVLVLISAKDRAVFISRGSGVEARLTDATLDKIINRMKPHLKAGRWEAGFVSAVLDVSHVLSSGAVRSDPSDEISWTGVGLFILAAFGFAVFHHRNSKKAHELTRGREALDSLIKDAKTAEHRVYMTTSCPMCLEDFAPEVELGDAAVPAPSSTVATDGNTQAGGLLPKTLPCGHVFCEPCIRQYLDTAATSCPVCRVSIRHLDDGTPGEFEGAAESRDPSSRRRYRSHMQMLMFRSSRIRERYPRAMDPTTHSVLEAAVHSGSLSDAIVVVERRSTEVQTMIADFKKRMSSDGSGSKRSSFGGGRSSGGRGGRF